MVQMVAIHKPSGLLTVHRLLELTAEEGIADIELMHRPTIGRGKGEHNAYGRRLDNRRERLIEINAGCWVSPRNTQHAFRRSSKPSGWSLFFRIHLPEMMRAPCGRGTRHQVSLRRRALYSSCMARRPWSSRSAALMEGGTGGGSTTLAMLA
jgi:hypothetical protein